MPYIARVVSQTPTEMILDDGVNFALLGGAAFIAASIVISGWSVYSSYPSFDIANSISFPAMFFFLGTIFLFSGSCTTVVIAKSRGQILFYKKRLVGTNTETYNIGNVLRVEFRKEYKMEKTNVTVPRGSGFGSILRQPFLQPQQVLVSQSIIVFKDGKELPLESARILSTGTTFGNASVAASISSQIASFIGVPFEETNRGVFTGDIGIPDGRMQA